MNKENLRIVFLGNPEFARYHLEQLVKAGFNIVAVVSAADKPAGRGLQMHSTPVAEYARKQGIPLLQPKNLKSEDFLEELRSYNADIQVVIAFRMLPEAVWDMPPKGTVNIHASLLPQYRGAAPINWAIINGETETGVTSFKLKHEIDTGDILLQKSCAITEEDTAGSLHDKLMLLGSETIIETLEGIITDTIQEQAQLEFKSEELKSAPKLFSSSCSIDWNKNGTDIINFIRGLCPYPVAHTKLQNKRLKIFKASFERATHSILNGEFIFDGNEDLKVSCNDGFIHLVEVQLEGKRKMNVDEFLRGYKT